MAQPLVGSGYDAFIGTRQNPGQTQTEFYNKETNQGYSSAGDLLRAVQPYAGNQVVNEGNVFNVLSQGYTPQAQALGQIKNDLNSFQQDTFNSGNEPGKRAASSLGDQIGSEQGNYDTYFKEYNDLKTKLQGLQTPNYQDTYNQIRQSSGIIGTENDFANNQKSIRELPYVNRQNFGNAGVATEGQLGADTQQKGIPLEIQQANLLDRLKLAQDFVNNSLKFKEMDSNAARQSLSDGLQTALQTIDLSRQHLSDLQTQQKSQQDQQAKAQQFAYENRIGQPFYEIGGTIYRTSDGKAYPTPEQFFADGGTKDFKNVQKVDISKTFANQLALRQVERQELESNRDYGLNKDKLANDKFEFQQNYNLDLNKFNLEQQKLLLDNKSSQNKALSADELLKFGGLPAGTTWQDITSAELSPQKPPTDAQLKVATYTDRIKQASDIMDSVADGISKINSFNYGVQTRLPNWSPGKSDTVKVQQQAEDNFLNAVLRQESGAAISDSERVNAKKQYFPQPGDSAQVLANKKKNRETVLNGFAREAGPAYGGSKSLFELEQSVQGNVNEKGGVSKKVSSVFPSGTNGGQCGTFAHKIVNFPSVGDSIAEKYASVNKYGLTQANWLKQGARIGDVLISNDDKTYGHVQVVTAVLTGGRVQLSESNRDGKGTISNSRIISINSPNIYGAIRGTLKI